MTTIPIRRAESESSSLLVLAVEDRQEPAMPANNAFNTNSPSKGNASNEDPLIISGSSFGGDRHAGTIVLLGHCLLASWRI